MPEQGVASTFKLGLCYGLLHGIVRALEVPVTEYRPSIWKTQMVGVRATKADSITKLKEILPSCGKYISKNLHHNRAEAALIAIYAADQLYTKLKNQK